MRGALVIGLAFMACSNPDTAVPDGVLPRDRFKEVLLKAQLIEARMNQEVLVEHAGSIPAERYYAEMFQAEGTTKEQFRISFDHYAGKPEDMKAIYEEILNELSLRKDQGQQ